MKRFFIRLWFKFLLNRGNLIKVDDRHRGIGKTTMLVKKAVKEDMAIVVGNQMHVDYIKDMNPNAKILRLAPNFTIEIRGNQEKYPNGVLIDESVDPKVISELHSNRYRIKGGFINKENVAGK